jgi:hypothetical protein
MHIHVPHRPAWGVVLAITVVALWLGGFECVRLFEILKTCSLPIARGRVLHREEISRWGIPLARLTIREGKSGVAVSAVTHNHTADRFGEFVQFHYSGNPREEVHLVGEDNPLWLLLFAWGLPVLLWVIYFALKRSPRYRCMVE